MAPSSSGGTWRRIYCLLFWQRVLDPRLGGSGNIASFSRAWLKCVSPALAYLESSHGFEMHRRSRDYLILSFTFEYGFMLIVSKKPGRSVNRPAALSQALVQLR
jgi:hypothetical protein